MKMKAALKKSKRKGSRKKKSTRKTALPPKRAHGKPVPEPKTPGFPASYGKDALVLMVRDPWWVYAYWEITPSREGEVLARAGSRAVRVLRVYRHETPQDTYFFDIETGVFADNWYVDVGEPDRLWSAEIGLRADNGRFHSFLRSNVVRTPRCGVSDEIDPEWNLPDDIWGRICQASGSGADSPSSLGLYK